MRIARRRPRKARGAASSSVRRSWGPSRKPGSSIIARLFFPALLRSVRRPSKRAFERYLMRRGLCSRFCRSCCRFRCGTLGLPNPPPAQEMGPICPRRGAFDAVTVTAGRTRWASPSPANITFTAEMSQASWTAITTAARTSSAWISALRSRPHAARPWEPIRSSIFRMAVDATTTSPARLFITNPTWRPARISRHAERRLRALSMDKRPYDYES